MFIIKELNKLNINKKHIYNFFSKHNHIILKNSNQNKNTYLGCLQKIVVAF